MRGRLILIEGLDRSGKSTQAENLALALDAQLYKFPDRSTPIGKLINEYLVNSSFDLSDEAAHLLFSANRWEVAHEMEATLIRGQNIVLDRYIYSGIAYSLAKSSLNDYEWLYSPDKGLPKPDLTLFLTIDLEELSRRKGWGDERYEKSAFQAKVKQCFMQILDPEKDSSVEIVNVDNLSIEQVKAKLMEIIKERKVDQPTEKPLAKFK
ncbi:putative bifunctional thymidylate/uridylate kinase [Clavispora lusitaniae]|uniref:Thymidylate kinase n=1 Tax=Clavispora lusitaniae TaxID=36911 RepID=A0AA91Q501_CLALS|nr:putative bifunctional thymidylate/uridylate kinase [Clavispora lusitaniae]